MFRRGCDDLKVRSLGGEGTLKMHLGVQREGIPRVDEIERTYFLSGSQ